MALVRILVDGYSLLHGWPELAPGKPRHSAAAREELVYALTRYRDAIGTPITIVFDGASGVAAGGGEIKSTPEVEILFSRTGQTADDIIERVAYRMRDYGEVLAVTDDNAERDMIIGMGGMAQSCLNFIRAVESAATDLENDLKEYNRRERAKFKRAR